MANNVIKRIWNQNKMVNIEALQGMAFQAEDGGHTFEISGVDNAGTAVPLSGTVAGVFMRPDRADIALVGSASGGVVSVTLTDDCYAVPGRFGLTIFVTSGGQKTAVYAAVGTVAVTSGGAVAGDAPQDVVDLINAIDEAVASIPASYTGLIADIAPTYSSSAVYSVGAYVYYNGDLYRCTTPITTAETWTAAHWTAAVLGDDVGGLRSVVSDNTKIIQKVASLDSWNISFGMDGAIKNKSLRRDGTIYDTPGVEYKIIPYLGGTVTTECNDRGNGHLTFFDSTMTIIPNSGSAWWLPANIVCPEGTAYFGITLPITSGEATTVNQTINLNQGVMNALIASFQKREGIAFSKGTISATGELAPENNGVYTTDLLRDIYVIDAVNFVLCLYDNNGYYIGKINSSGGLDRVAGNWKYFTGRVDVKSIQEQYSATFIRICILPNDGTIITSDNANTYGNSHSDFYTSLTSGKMDKIHVEYDLGKSSLVSGSLQTATMEVSPNIACVSYLTKIPANGNETILIEPPQIDGVASYAYRFGFYNASGTYLDQIIMQASNKVTLPSDARYFSFHIVGLDSGGSQVSFNVLAAFSDTDVIKIIYANRFVPTDDFATKDWVENNFARSGNGYSIGPNYTRYPVLSTLQGTLTYLQSFCIYNGKYYSTDGSHIAEQDDGFTLLRQADISIGHGNSLQIGTSGKAYASGWNDNKVYVVNLGTLSVESVINLPTTGYTTAAIDDKNKIAYIFQRDTYPDTNADYNFIVYDYDNEQIVSRKIIKSFGAMQSCDFLNGKIAVSYGLGNSVIPNGLDVYNTSGDIIGSFDMDIFGLTEIEGVAFDRTNGHGVYISFYNRQVYLIE